MLSCASVSSLSNGLNALGDAPPVHESLAQDGRALGDPPVLDDEPGAQVRRLDSIETVSEDAFCHCRPPTRTRDLAQQLPSRK